MKNILIIGLISISCIARAQYSKTEIISKEIAFGNADKDNVFYLANINGGIVAEGYSGDKVMLEATKTIKAKTEARLQKGLEELSIGIIDRLDTVIVYIKGPCAAFGEKQHRHKMKKDNWSYDWDDCDYEYDFEVDFKLKIPKNMRVHLSTINNGNIEVAGLNEAISLNNVNGAISITGARSEVYAYTINGDVTIDYAVLPPSGQSYFYTLNGDIKANYPKGLQADMTFKSFNGDFFTNIDEIEHKPNVVKRSADEKTGVSFKVDTRSLITVRGGGTQLDFETFNGDVYVKENK